MAKYSSVLFDLDGNLLPMDMDNFIKIYFGSLAKYMVPYGYEPESFIAAVWAGTKAMIKNDGTMANENRLSLPGTSPTKAELESVPRRLPYLGWSPS